MNNKKINKIVLTVFFAITAIILIWGKCFSIAGNEMAYSILCFYLCFPLTSLICSFLLGMQSNQIKWLLPIPFIFGIINDILLFVIFHVWGGMLYFALSFLPAILGLFTGIAWRIRKGKRRL